MSRAFTPLESDVQRTIVAVAASKGVRLIRRNVMAMGGEHKGKRWFVKNGEKGQSDLYGVLPNGIHIEVEVKRKGEVPTPDQTAWLRKWAPICPAFWADNATTFGRVLDAILAGGKVVYGEGYDYDVVMEDA